MTPNSQCCAAKALSSCTSATIHPSRERKTRTSVNLGGITPAAILPGLTVQIRNYTLQVDFLILPLGTTNMILGLDVLSALGATITCNPMGVEFNPNVNLGRGNIPVRKVESLDRLPGWEKEVAQDSSNEVSPKGIWMVSGDNLPEDYRAVGPISDSGDQTTGWADRTTYSKGVPETLYYSDNEILSMWLMGNHKSRRKSSEQNC